MTDEQTKQTLISSNFFFSDEDEGQSVYLKAFLLEMCMLGSLRYPLVPLDTSKFHKVLKVIKVPKVPKVP